MAEDRATRVKRLQMRSMRRGIKEMDLILQSFATVRLDDMPDPTLDLYEQLLEESDHDLYQWVSGQTPAPAPYGDLISAISRNYQPLSR